MPHMHYIEHGIWLGAMEAAAEYFLPNLQASGITGILNVAFNLDVAYPFCDPVFRYFPLEYAKVGLEDGPKPHAEGPVNQIETLVAAVYALRGLRLRCERVLVHCHQGGSRSVIVAALYLAVYHPSDFPDLQDSLNLILRRREITPYPYPVDNIESTTRPMPGLYRLARAIFERRAHLFAFSSTAATPGNSFRPRTAPPPTISSDPGYVPEDPHHRPG